MSSVNQALITVLNAKKQADSARDKALAAQASALTAKIYNKYRIGKHIIQWKNKLSPFHLFLIIMMVNALCFILVFEGEEMLLAIYVSHRLQCVARQWQ